MTAPTGAPTIAHARSVLSDARLQRSEHLVALAAGLLTPLDVVESAAHATGRPLRRITLKQLHLSQEGWGKQRTTHLLSELAAKLGIRSDDLTDKTIAWLIDPRAGGRRYLAWLDVQQEKTAEPWAGFPFTAAEGLQ